MVIQSRRMTFVASLLLVAGCFGGNPSYMEATESAVQPTSGKALVKIHRLHGSGPSKMVPIWDRETVVGHSNPGSTIVYECEPGEHLFIAVAGSSSLLKAQLLSDKVYDIVLELRMGMTSAKARLIAVSERNLFSKRLPVLDRMRHVTPNPAAMESYGMANRPGIQNIIARYDQGRWVGLVDELHPTDHR